MKPVLSVNIACWNRKDMLRECIETFINQTFKDWELIMVDDGSDDDLTFVTTMDSRIKYFRKEHSGISKSFNYALDRSSGQYILAFGSDDLATNNTLLERLVHTLDERKKRGFNAVYTDYWEMNKDGNLIRKKHYDAHQRHSHEECYKMMLKQQFIPHGATIWEIDKHPRYDENLESAEDWELFLTALENGVKFYHIPERLWTYRTGHLRERSTQRQIDGCKQLLAKRGYKFNEKTRQGYKE